MVTISFVGVADAEGNLVGRDQDLAIGALYGDANQDGVVDRGDASDGRPLLGQTVSADNYTFDLNIDGKITLDDGAVISQNRSHSVP